MSIKTIFTGMSLFFKSKTLWYYVIGGVVIAGLLYGNYYLLKKTIKLEVETSILEHAAKFKSDATVITGEVVTQDKVNVDKIIAENRKTATALTKRLNELERQVAVGQITPEEKVVEISRAHIQSVHEVFCMSQTDQVKCIEELAK